MARDDVGMRMARGVDRDARGAIEEHVAVDIFDARRRRRA